MPSELPCVLHARMVTGAGGGPEKTILHSPRYLPPLGYRARCAYLRPPGDPGFGSIRARARDLDAPLDEIDDRGPFDFRVVRRLLAVCRRENVAIWHSHDYKTNAIGLVLRWFHPMRLMSTVHGWVQYTRRTPLYYAIDRLCLRHYERVVCVSEDLRRRCLDTRMPADRCVVVHNAIDTERWTRRTRPPEAKRRLGFAPDRLLVGAMGRLSDEKNFEGLVRAADSLLSRGLDFDLIVVGDGADRARLESMLAELGRSDRVRLLGQRGDAFDLFEAMDVFVLSSIREGLPNVLLEAMAMEVPVVATRLVGVEHLVVSDEQGLLVEPGDVPALADALGRMLGDAALRRALAQSARARIEADFSFARRMEKMAALYDDLLGRA
ncbi:MAG: glycosyltransferase [Pirellulales bacterium]|nr:glycosyltransferase [Pirellulales bacterium]